jgi:hypothetical protein
MKRNLRRAYDAEAGAPMPLSNMREHGVRSVEGTCEDCKHVAIINVDSLPDGLYMPDATLRVGGGLDARHKSECPSGSHGFSSRSFPHLPKTRPHLVRRSDRASRLLPG